MDEDPPPGQVILGLATVVMQHDASAPGAGRQDRGDGSQEKRPVRGREDMNDVGVPEAEEARKVEDLVHARPDNGIAAKPPQPGGKPRVDGDERDRIAVATQALHQGVRLNPVTPEDVETGGDQGDVHHALLVANVES